MQIEADWEANYPFNAVHKSVPESDIGFTPEI